MKAKSLGARFGVATFPPDAEGLSGLLALADQAMLEYSEKLTLRPWDMEEKDVIRLRDVGFSDAAILDINQVTAYFAYANRLVDGLGVELEPIWNGASE